MHSLKATVVLGALLSTGLLMAQLPDSTQTPDPGIAQAAPAQPAQPATSRPANPNKQAHRLARELNLSADQEAQITPILADRIQQMQSLHNDPSLSQRDRHRKAREIMQDSNSKIEALLNDTQRKQYQQMLAQRRDHRKGGSAAVPQA